ncbi:hypothetical protein [Sediminimonas qiaohouensis]|uniref:hypothetical protein n=1 Tax=Sediminimonas qiaohouensis TaxID=552061 RepID=UPI0012ED1B3D|nr:hypothetical protein [Sediminimonas qiaohouensis]
MTTNAVAAWLHFTGFYGIIVAQIPPERTTAEWQVPFDAPDIPNASVSEELILSHVTEKRTLPRPLFAQSHICAIWWRNRGGRRFRIDRAACRVIASNEEHSPTDGAMRHP